MEHEIIVKLETAIDHLSGEELGLALEALNEMPETLDALFLPGIGKKNRPAGLLQVLCAPGHEETLCAAIFRHTHTLGVRIQKIERVVLPRFADNAEVDGEILPAKIYEVEGYAFARPEADALRGLARRRKTGAPALRFAKYRK